MTVRRDTAGTLTALARLSAEGRTDTRRSSSLAEQISESLPRRMGGMGARGSQCRRRGESGAEFLAAMFSDSPWQNGAAGVPAIAAIQNPELQAAAAGAWATRWAVVEPDAARAWAEKLPPAARARALTGLWREDTPPDACRPAGAAAGTIPGCEIAGPHERQRAGSDRRVDCLTTCGGCMAPGQCRAHLGWHRSRRRGVVGGQLPEAELRVRIVSAVIQPWLNREPEAALNWLAASPLDDEDRTFVSDLTGL